MKMHPGLTAAVGILWLGAAAAPASAQGTYTLNLSAPPTAVVDQTLIIQASGSNPPEDFFTSWLDVSAIPTGVLSTCPTGYLTANQVARSAFAQGGEVVTNSQREDVDAAGNFSMPVGWAPTMPGPFLICGYTNDGATGTLATATLTITVAAAPGPAAAPLASPANVARPRVRRSGRTLVCERGSWSNDPSRYAYGWLVDGVRRRGARRRTLAVSRNLRGRSVQCSVTASNAAGATTALSRAFRVR